MTTKAAGWRNRIIGTEEVAPDQLLGNPGNWRIHPKAQQDALSAVLDRVGWVQDVIVNRRTSHVVDGHLRVALAISRGEATVPVAYVDLDDEEEALVLASLDPIAAMAGGDDAQLATLLAEVQLDSPALDAMFSALLTPVSGGFLDAAAATPAGSEGAPVREGGGDGSEGYAAETALRPVTFMLTPDQTTVVQGALVRAREKDPSAVTNAAALLLLAREYVALTDE